MKTDRIARPLATALHGIRKHSREASRDSFRRRLALRLHMTRQLGPLSLEQVMHLVEQARIRDYRAGETVLERMDAGRYHLLVLQGEVEVRRRTAASPGTGEAHTLLRPMDVMGGFAMLNAVTRDLRATAVSEVRCLLIDAECVDGLLGWNELVNPLKRTDPEIWRWAESLRDARLFTRIPPYRLEAVLRSMFVLGVEAGEVVVRAGDPVDRVLILEAGEAEAWRRDPATGRETRVARLEAGDAVGEHLLMPAARHATTVRMLTPGRLRVLAKSDLEALTTGALQPGVEPPQARALLETGAARLLDCRCGVEVLEPRIPQARGMPLDRLRWDMHELDRGQQYIVCCRSGTLARVASFLLCQRHFRAVPLAGGINAWPYGLEWGE